MAGMRHFVGYIGVLRNQWVHLYGERDPPTRQTYDRHVAWLKEIVPEERLLLFDVKEGWSPLCKALDKPEPEGIPFPRINDGEAIDKFAKKMVKRGLLRWLLVLVTLGLALIPFIYV
ncbi:hypothetical protein SLS60_003540 [Paraconiothyrium brasiliense]|uniref:Uncharacterized protein n=1 Tax=Paraconiothyrium brasiliense TaxID=300254 RepID=A0ABR3RNW5_9PLEO